LPSKTSAPCTPLLLAQGWQLQVLQAGVDRSTAEAADLLVVLGPDQRQRC
jgi:hypothetical protein